ncbi:MAG TPA: adenylate/guanylate cyclase domain-containing protein [Mycobacteriales bacterium]|nr:adenylate/guanylate cyclase domain-containing protein [Mycobacteriales bacterium]
MPATESLGEAAALRATVALLFSDIEGSTRLLQQLGPAYAGVLLAHREILRSAFAANGGVEQGTEGDSFFVTFPNASNAVVAALAGQRSLAAHSWPAEGTARVRMGIHVGEIQTVAGTTVGMAIHEAARIGAAAHGGQVLVSAVAAVLAGALPDTATLLDLGPYRLKDIGEPIHLYQLTHDDLPADFPPPRSQGASRNNLPAQVSGFIGRSREVAEVAALLGKSRLVTVTGAGGAGKSRVALRVAAEQGSRFDDGVWFVDLAPVSNAAAVAQQIAGALGLSDLAAADLGEAIGQRSLLLLVDNCEHLIAAVGEVVDDLLRRCPGVSVLATSRESLTVQGEVAWRLPSLAHADAVDLFCTRARAVNSRFALTDTNREAVADLCARLDFIPLALELAAARLGSLSVEQLVGMLDQRFRLLTGGTRGALARQRTLQATVDWSYDLLDSPAQAVLRRLGVFVGGFTLEAAEVVCTTADVDAIDVLDLVDQLVAKSLVMAEEREGDVRYLLLETIRHYALDRLLQAGEMTAARDAHLRWAAALAADAESTLWFGGGDHAYWMARLDDEDGNSRSAFSWALESGELHAATSTLIATLFWFLARSRYAEGLDMCERLLAVGVSDEDRSIVAFTELMLASHGRLDDDMLVRARRDIGLLPRSSHPWLALPADGYIAAMSIVAGDESSVERAVAACRAAVDAARGARPAVLAMTLQALSWACMEAGDLDAAHAAVAEAAGLMSASGFDIWESRLCANLAHVAIRAGDLDAAWQHAERAVETARRGSDTWMTITVTRLLSEIAARGGDVRSARDLSLSLLDAVAEAESDQALARVHRDIARYALLDGDLGVADGHATRAVELVAHSPSGAGDIFSVAGATARANGDLPRAWTLHLRGGRSRGRTGSASAELEILASVVEGLAGVRVDLGDPEGAALLLGAAAAHRPANSSRLEVEDQLVAAIADSALTALGATEFEARWNEGASLDLDTALAAAEAMTSPV